MGDKYTVNTEAAFEELRVRYDELVKAALPEAGRHIAKVDMNTEGMSGQRQAAYRDAHVKGCDLCSALAPVTKQTS